MKQKECPRCHRYVDHLIPWRTVTGNLFNQCFDCESKAYNKVQESRVIFDVKAMRPKKLFG